MAPKLGSLQVKLQVPPLGTTPPHPYVLTVLTQSLWPASPAAVLTSSTAPPTPHLCLGSARGPLGGLEGGCLRQHGASPVTLLSPRSLKDRTTQAGSVSPEATHIFLVTWRLPGCPTNRMPLGTEIFTCTCRGQDVARGACNVGALPARPTTHRVSPPQKPCSSGTASFLFPIRTSYLPLSCSEPPLYFTPQHPTGAASPQDQGGFKGIFSHIYPGHQRGGTCCPTKHF